MRAIAGAKPTAHGPQEPANGMHRLGEALRLLWSLSDTYIRGRLAVTVVFIAGAAITAALTPVALKLAIDSLSGKGVESFGPIALILAYVVGQYVTRCLSELRFLAHGQAQGRMYRNVALNLFRHIIRLPVRFHLARRTGEMGQIGEQGIDGCEQLLHNTVFTVLPVALEFVAVAFVLLHFGYPTYLGLLAIAAVAYVIVFERGAKGVHEPAYAMAAARVEAHAIMTDNLMNAEAIKYYDAEQIVSRRYDSNLAQVETAWRRFAQQRASNGLLVATVFAASLGVMLVHAAMDVARGTMSVGDFVLINSYVMRFMQPLELLGFALREISRALASLQQLFNILREHIEVDRAGVGLDNGCHRGELAFESISFSYRPDRVVLREVSVSVAAGRTLAVVGASGSGKSSLIRLLFRLYEPDSGRILLDGMPVTELPLSTLRQAIAIVPQDTVLFHDSIANNIAFGRLGASRAEIEEAARVANLHDFIITQPDGYETTVGERGLKLSGGERQRVAIARAALKRPRIFVFDEATSSLDSKTEQEILRNLREVSCQRTTLVIAHRLSTVVHADEIVVLHEGAVVERGSHHALLQQDGHYSSLWRAQQSSSRALVT